ncbi:neuropeptide FF receptor 1-like [Hyperolius riggenbachi]|uniref:neuropeptide FF receptor 1-like n=1 Tax=Hyperolius riggenbachi TaxID=752182 RepID=UPI0035A31269
MQNSGNARSLKSSRVERPHLLHNESGQPVQYRQAKAAQRLSGQNGATCWWAAEIQDLTVPTAGRKQQALIFNTLLIIHTQLRKEMSPKDNHRAMVVTFRKDAPTWSTVQKSVSAFKQETGKDKSPPLRKTGRENHSEKCGKDARFGWPFDNIMCKMSGLVQGMSVSASVFTLVAIAVERFRCIVYPFRQKLTLRNAILTIIVIWLLALIIMCPSAVTLTVTRDDYHFMVDDYNNFYPLYSCWEAWPDKEMRKIYTTVLFSHIYLAPLTLIVIMYARIAFKLFKSSATIRGSASEEHEGRRVSKRKVRVINMLIMVALFFTLSWLPLWTLMLLTDYGNLSDFQLNIIAVYVFPFAHWLAFFNSSVNPIIYGYFNENFRRGFQEAFKVQFCSLKTEHNETYSERKNSGFVFGVRNRIFVEVQPSDSAQGSDGCNSNSGKSGMFSLRSGRIAHHGLVVEELENKSSNNTVSIPAWDI